MRFINKKMVVVVIMIGIISSILIWKNMSDKETKLESVSLNESKTLNNEMFAIMLEQSDGTYKESTEKLWPTNSIYKYDDTRSGCIDINGNKIENALMYDSENKIASVETSNTSYCYLYFSIPKICETGTQLGDCLLENPTLALNTNVEGGLYRYQGSVADNYICFGTSNQTECLNNKDKYLYRIIGIDENKKLKLIKNYSIGNYAWYSDSTADITWPNSDLFKGLNGLEQENITPIFIDNITYDYMEINSNWYNKIAGVDWKYGDTTSIGNYNAETMYIIENGWNNTISAKIGLMYIHDYYYAYGIGGNPGTYIEGKTAWIFSASNEWTMSRYGYYTNSELYRAWNIVNYGMVNWPSLANNNSGIRPVFYITPDLQYILGLGTKSYPFIIK